METIKFTDQIKTDFYDNMNIEYREKFISHYYARRKLLTIDDRLTDELSIELEKKYPDIKVIGEKIFDAYNEIGFDSQKKATKLLIEILKILEIEKYYTICYKDFTIKKIVFLN